MALNTLVSFNRKIIFATNAGILVDMAWGRITYLSTCPELIPRLMALSFWIGSTASRPLRNASAI